LIKIIAVGRIKEKFYEDAVAEYAKRLSAYTKLKIEEVADEKCPERISEKEAEQIKYREGSRILKHIRDDEYVVTLEIAGKPMPSEDFSRFIRSREMSGRPDITFVIGGSIGLSTEVSARADMKLSFSEMTFPHQLMRVILTEQIYRAYRIMRGEPYHK